MTPVVLLKRLSTTKVVANDHAVQILSDIKIEEDFTLEPDESMLDADGFSSTIKNNDGDDNQDDPDQFMILSSLEQDHPIQCVKEFNYSTTNLNIERPKDINFKTADDHLGIQNVPSIMVIKAYHLILKF